jgi:hypothetical protein
MSSRVTVCAMIYDEHRWVAVSELSAAVAGQSRKPDRVICLSAGESGLAAGVRRGLATGCDWLWLLDGGAVPELGALDALLAVATAAKPPGPVLLASKVVDSEGGLHPDSLPRHEIFEKERTVNAAAHHLVHLRWAAHGSVLAAADAVGRFAPPRSRLAPGQDMREWSARILRDWGNPGYLVPASLAVRPSGQSRTPAARGDWAARVRVLGSAAWSPTERLWEAFLLGREIGTGFRVRRSHGRQGVGAPGRKPSSSPRRIAAAARPEK